jgi:hypothetical protein
MSNRGLHGPTAPPVPPTMPPLAAELATPLLTMNPSNLVGDEPDHRNPNNNLIMGRRHHRRR